MCLEIVIDGLSEEDIKIAMFKAMKKMIGVGREKGLIGLSAGNYGGKLGTSFPSQGYID